MSLDSYSPDYDTFRFTLTLRSDVGSLLAEVCQYTHLSPSAVVSYLLGQTDLADMVSGIHELQADGLYLPKPSRKRHTATASADVARTLGLIPRVSESGLSVAQGGSCD